MPGLLAIYPVTESITQKALRAVIDGALECLGTLPDSLPEGLRARCGLPELNEALRAIHRPQTLEAAAAARGRLAFEVLLLFMLLLRDLRAERESLSSARPLACADDCARRFAQALGFEIIGTVPEAFDSRSHGLVGLHVMHLPLD